MKHQWGKLRLSVWVNNHLRELSISPNPAARDYPEQTRRLIRELTDAYHKHNQPTLFDQEDT